MNYKPLLAFLPFRISTNFITIVRLINRKLFTYLCSEMKKREIKKETVLKSVSKMVTDKEIVRSYIKGKTSIQTLVKKGIKFAKPL